MRGTWPLLAESVSVAEHARDCLRRSPCAAYGAEFFLYEKMGRRAIDHAGSTSEAGSNKSVQTCPLTPKKTGIQGDASPWQVARRVKACGFDPWAELSRSCPPITRRF